MSFPRLPTAFDPLAPGSVGCFAWGRSTRSQNTIAEPRRIPGRPLFVPIDTEIALLPAAPDTGRVFNVRGTLIPATVEFLHIDPTRRTTSLRNGPAQVNTTEHLMAAINACGIDNLLIDCPDGEIPGGDGSAELFFNHLIEAGIRSQEGHHPELVSVIEEGIMETADWSIAVAPSSGGSLAIDAFIDFPEVPIGRQTLHYQDCAHSFGLHLARARTFATKPTSIDAARLLLPGFEAEILPGRFLFTNMIIARAIATSLPSGTTTSRSVIRSWTPSAILHS